MANVVAHFEIHADAPAKLADFYRTVLGWQLDKAPGIDDWRIRTAEEDASWRGGLTYRASPTLHWLNYINVASVDEAVEQVTRLGGSVVRLKASVPRTGWYAIVADPEDIVFAVWQPDPTAMPAPEPE